MFLVLFSSFILISTKIAEIHSLTHITFEFQISIAKATIKAREEEISELKEKIGILTVERDDEAKTCERLKRKNTELKESEATRSKALDEDRQAIAKVKRDFETQIMENNAKLRSALASLLKAKKNYTITSSEDSEEGEEPHSTPKEDQQDESTSRVAELEKILKDTEDKLSVASSEKTKLEGNLAATILEYEKLDEFSRSLQSRYEAIQTWYEVFEEWNSSAKCSSCGTSLDVGTIVDKLIETKNSNSNPPTEAEH